LNISLLFKERGHFVVGHRLGKLVVYLVKLFEQVDRLLHTLFDNFADGFGFIEMRFLFEETNGEARRDNCLANEFLVDPGDYAEQRALA
jgi:hypothetical protein